jgi:hypothetical protein
MRKAAVCLSLTCGGEISLPRDIPPVPLWYISVALFTIAGNVRRLEVCELPGKTNSRFNLRLGPQSEPQEEKEKPVMRKVLVLCLAMCFVFALTAMAFDDMGKATTVNGWVTDAKCGAKMANTGGEACTKKCAAAGEKLVIVTDGDQKVLAVDNQDALKAHAGHHVAVTGTMGADSIHVNNVKML